MIKRYMTFGAGQMLQGYQIEIIGEDDMQIRRAIFKNFGKCYSSVYDKPSEWEKILCTVDLSKCDVPSNWYNSLLPNVEEEEDD